MGERSVTVMEVAAQLINSDREPALRRHVEISGARLKPANVESASTEPTNL